MCLLNKDKLLLKNPSGKGTSDWGFVDFESSETRLDRHLPGKPPCMVIDCAFTVYVSIIWAHQKVYASVKLCYYHATKIKTDPQYWLAAYLQNLMQGSSFKISRESILRAVASFWHVTCFTFNSFSTMPSFHVV